MQVYVQEGSVEGQFIDFFAQSGILIGFQPYVARPFKDGH
jgi:hypothetical protein